MIVIESWQEDVKKVSKNIPDDFIVYIAALVGGKNGNYTHVKYTGAVFGKYERGAKKGEYCSRKMVKGSKEVFYVNIKDAY